MPFCPTPTEYMTNINNGMKKVGSEIKNNFYKNREGWIFFGLLCFIVLVLVWISIMVKYEDSEFAVIFLKI